MGTDRHVPPTYVLVTCRAAIVSSTPASRYRPPAATANEAPAKEGRWHTVSRWHTAKASLLRTAHAVLNLSNRGTTHV
jgi:hypothetical protein